MCPDREMRKYYIWKEPSFYIGRICRSDGSPRIIQLIVTSWSPDLDPPITILSWNNVDGQGNWHISLRVSEYGSLERFWENRGQHIKQQSAVEAFFVF